MNKYLVDRIDFCNQNLDIESNRVVILASGGMDSTALIDYAVTKGIRNVILYYNIISNNGKKVDRERKTIQSIMHYYEQKGIIIELYENEISINSTFENVSFKQIPLHVLSILSASAYKCDIWIGYCMGDEATSIIDDIKQILNSYRPITCDNKILNVHFPLSKISKKEIIFNIDNKLLEFVTFCEYEGELDDNNRCGKCDTCKRYEYELRKFDISYLPFVHYNSVQNFGSSEITIPKKKWKKKKHNSKDIIKSTLAHSE